MDKDTIAQAKDLFDRTDRLMSQWRQQARTEIDFAHGKQWLQDVEARRREANLPVLTIDRLEGPISQLVGDQRLNDIAIRVVCKSRDERQFMTLDGKEIDESTFVSGLVRDIQRQSRFDWVQSQAYEHAVVCGLGGWYVMPEYTSHKSFDQRLCIYGVDDPMRLYPDIVNWGTPHGMDYAIITEGLQREAFAQRYPTASGAWTSPSAGMSTADDEVELAYCWMRTYTDSTLELVRLPGGALKAMLADEAKPPGTLLVRTRKVRVPKVRYYVLTDNEVLESTEWAGQYIPVAIVTGRKRWVDGQVDLIGIVRKAMDPQRMYNYTRSAAAEFMGIAPRAPYLATPAQISGHEKMWAMANMGVFPYLLFNPDPEYPASPQRQQVSYPTGFAQEAIVAAQDIMAVTKIHEAGLGIKSNETSGVAIEARQREGDVGNYVYQDNLLLAVEETGRILVDALPKYYDTTRLVTARNKDGSTHSVMLNWHRPDGMFNTMSADFDVEAVSGPSFGTAKQEAVAAMTELFRAAPSLASVGADLWIGSQSWEGAQELAKRLKKMLPPELREEEGEDPHANIAQLQAAVQQLQAALQQSGEQQAQQEAQLAEARRAAEEATAKLTKMEIELATERAKHRIDLQESELERKALDFKYRQAAYNADNMTQE